MIYRMDLILKVLSVTLLVMGEWALVKTNLYDPHVKPQTGPFFEGWYMRMIDTNQSRSLGVLWGYVVPESPKNASKLAFIGALRSEASGTERLLDYNAFPAVKDTRYTVKGGQNVTQDPDISSPAWMTLTLKNIGGLIVKQNSTKVDVNIGGHQASGTMGLGKATPWHEDFTGPEGSVMQRLPLPLHWFVFSLWTPVTWYAITDRTTGELIRGNNGMVHMEKNWGDSFPESWIWAQGAVAQPQKVVFALTYGLLDIFRLSIPASLAGYRNYDKGISLDFTPVNSILDVNYSQCSDPATLWIKYYTPFYRKIIINITAPYDSFSDCIFGPLEQGFRRVCQESFVGVALVQVYEWGLFSGWKQIDHQIISLAALEFGGKWTCRPCQT